MKVTLKQYHTEACKPWRKHDDDLGFDCVATERKIVRVLGIPVRVDYMLGFGYDAGNLVGFMGFARSSVRDRYMILTNGVGLLDPSYRGECQASFYVKWPALIPWIRKEGGKWKFSWNRLYEVGDRICQIVPTTAFLDVDFQFGKVGDTERGVGGHGSTGV